MIECNDNYVYRHRRLDTNEIFYVGIGKGRKYRAFDKIRRNDFWKNIITKSEYEINIVADYLDRESACELEELLIKEYGRRDLGLGTLVNLTDGGDGGTNWSQEMKDRISKSLTGRKQSKETIYKRSIKLKETWKSEELRELKRQQTNDLIKRGIINQKGKVSKKKGIKLSEEVKRKTSIGLKEYYKTNKPHNYIEIDSDIILNILNDFNSGVKKFKLHKIYKLSRSIIERIIREYENK